MPPQCGAFSRDLQDKSQSPRYSPGVGGVVDVTLDVDVKCEIRSISVIHYIVKNSYNKLNILKIISAETTTHTYLYVKNNF